MVFGRLPSWFGAPFAVWRVMFFCWWNVTHSKGLSNDSWRCIRTPSKNEDVFFLDWHCGWEVPQKWVHCTLSSFIIIIIIIIIIKISESFICYIDQLLPLKALTFTPPHPSANCSPAPGTSPRGSPRWSRWAAPPNASLRCRWTQPSWQRCGDFLKWWVSPTNPWVFLLNMIILGVWNGGTTIFLETPNVISYEKNGDFSTVILVFGGGKVMMTYIRVIFFTWVLWDVFPFTPIVLVIMSSKTSLILTPAFSRHFRWFCHNNSNISLDAPILGSQYFTGEATHPSTDPHVEALSYLRGFWRYGPSRLCHPERAVGLENICSKNAEKVYTSKNESMSFQNMLESVH